MIWTVGKLEEGFLAETGKYQNIEIGRIAFQDFEIEYFLNSAYYKVIENKLNSYDNLWLPREARKSSIETGISSNKGNSVITNDSSLLHDFGGLIYAYKASQIYVHPSDKGQSGIGTFVIPRPNDGGTTDLQTPIRILTSTLTRCTLVKSGDVYVPWSASVYDEDSDYTHYSLRPLTSIDTVKNIQLYTNTKDLLYRYYSVSYKTYISSLTGTVSSDYVLETYLGDIGGVGYVFWVHGMGIRSPLTISLADKDQKIEVAFGDEIASTAAAIANKSLTNKNEDK